MRKIPRRRAKSGVSRDHNGVGDLIDSIPDMTFRISRDFRYLEFHQGGAGLQPYAPPDRFLGLTIDEVLPPERAQLWAGRRSLGRSPRRDSDGLIHARCRR